MHQTRQRLFRYHDDRPRRGDKSMRFTAKPLAATARRCVLGRCHQRSQKSVRRMSNITETDATITDAGRRIATLSERQLECLTQASEGMSSKEIARQLGIAPSTVDNHIQTAIGKLDVPNRQQAVLLIDRLRRRTGPKIPLKDGANPSEKRLLPPLGGADNHASVPTRLLRIGTIAVLAIMVVLAVLLSIAGAVHILGR